MPEGGGAPATPPPPPGGAPSRSDRLRCAIVGAGRMGMVHGHLLQVYPGTDVVGFADPQKGTHDRLRLGVERLDVDAAGRCLDPHLAPADRVVQAAFVPQVRPIDAVRTKARGRQREVEWSGHGEERHARTVSVGLSRSSRRRPARGPPRPGRARRRSKPGAASRPCRRASPAEPGSPSAGGCRPA